ncbi:homoserine O-acetyltransferase MetX [Salinithrix halophila]|uniref:Homoserine O-acetyltransferase n=1 Tax=Salinithrix halophila TaxID=1485204 RepID=A0ABV8JAS8_9BACL
MPITAKTSTPCETKTRNLSIGSFELESGETLSSVEVAVETAGMPAPGYTNALLVCHALTGDSRTVGDESASGWWEGLIGPGGYVDTGNYFVITMNVLGGCNGTTGPKSINPITGQPYGSDFPFVSIRDMVRLQKRCLEEMGISSVRAVIGGSMGGMLVLEWGILYPKFADRLVPIATADALSPTAIAYNDIGRQAILSDPDYRGGHYYDGNGPARGLSIARMMGMITYRTSTLFEKRFSRHLQQGETINSLDSVFQIESYLRYQGKKLVDRFDANSYLYLLKAMDTHDIGRGRGGRSAALARIQCPVFVIGIREDILFPVHQQRELHGTLTQLGKSSKLLEVSSEYGHDAFLVEFDEIGPAIRDFLMED